MKIEIEVPQEVLDLCEKEDYEVVCCRAPKEGEMYIRHRYDMIETATQGFPRYNVRFIVRRKHREPVIEFMHYRHKLIDRPTEFGWTATARLCKGEELDQGQSLDVMVITNDFNEFRVGFGHWNDGPLNAQPTKEDKRLLSCPFCGGEPDERVGDTIICAQCDTAVHAHQWNQRAGKEN